MSSNERRSLRERVRAWLAGRETCPACDGERSLRVVTVLRATIVVDGRRAPASFTFFACDACGARFKQPLHGEKATPSDEEWRRYAERGGAT